jgi:hypothetical protein
MTAHLLNANRPPEPWGRGHRWRTLCGLLRPADAIAAKVSDSTCETCTRIFRARVDEEQRELAAEMATPIHLGGYASRSSEA